MNVDPLADYNPFYNSEHYIDGQHNGGVYNSGNLNPYIYTYQNPIKYVDPNGKQVHFMHGTGSHVASSYFNGSLENNFKRDFGNFKSHQWSGSPFNGGSDGRIKEGHRLLPQIIKSIDENIKNGKYVGTGIVIGGHSHGANLGRIVAAGVYNHLEGLVRDKKLDKIPIVNLLMINVPVLGHKAFNVPTEVNVIQVDAKNDWVAGFGQAVEGTSPIKGFYKDADFKFEYKDQISPKDCLGCFIFNHVGQASENVKIWYDKVKINIQTERKK